MKNFMKLTLVCSLAMGNWLIGEGVLAAPIGPAEEGDQVHDLSFEEEQVSEGDVYLMGRPRWLDNLFDLWRAAEKLKEAQHKLFDRYKDYPGCAICLIRKCEKNKVYTLLYCLDNAELLYYDRCKPSCP